VNRDQEDSAAQGAPCGRLKSIHLERLVQLAL
jgi:hypothetical protein